VGAGGTLPSEVPSRSSHMEAMMRVGILRLSRAYHAALLLTVLVVVSPVGVTVAWSAERKVGSAREEGHDLQGGDQGSWSRHRGYSNSLLRGHPQD